MQAAGYPDIRGWQRIISKIVGFDIFHRHTSLNKQQTLDRKA